MLHRFLRLCGFIFLRPPVLLLRLVLFFAIVFFLVFFLGDLFFAPLDRRGGGGGGGGVARTRSTRSAAHSVPTICARVLRRRRAAGCGCGCGSRCGGGGQARVLLTTNVLARGIDVPSVNMVINYDLPMTDDPPGSRSNWVPDCDTYIHRVGRTGRAGARGVAINFVKRGTKDVDTLAKLEQCVDQLNQTIFDERVYIYIHT